MVRSVEVVVVVVRLEVVARGVEVVEVRQSFAVEESEFARVWRCIVRLVKDGYPGEFVVIKGSSSEVAAEFVSGLYIPILVRQFVPRHKKRLREP